MGLHNSSATWQRFTDTILGPELEPYVLAYLDIIICTPSLKRHLEILREVMKILKDAGLTVSWEKCLFFRKESRFLGYVVNENGLHVDPGKVEAILNIPTHKNVKEGRRILGTTSWYKRFIPNFAPMVTPICNLLKKYFKFVWNDECEDASREIEQQLITAPLMTCLDFPK